MEYLLGGGRVMAGKKKIHIFCFVMLLMVSFLGNVTGCGTSSAEESEEVTPDNVCPASIMVNDKLYYCYWEVANTPAEDEICGTIQSCIEEGITGVPTENEQSNFESCVGEEWAISHGRVLIHCDGEWYKCVLSTVPGV